jgi:hypothetical protein
MRVATYTLLTINYYEMIQRTKTNSEKNKVSCTLHYMISQFAVPVYAYAMIS